MVATSTSLLKTLGASSIDTKELVTNLVNATKEPRQKLIDEQKKKVEVEISNTALLKGALTALKSAATEVGSVGSLNRLSISSSDSSIVTAEKSNSAVAKSGAYTVTVSQLATPQRTLIALPNAFTLGGAETLTLSRGDPADPAYAEVPVSLVSGASPSQIVAAINTSAKSFGVKATLIDTKTGDNPLKIVLESTTGSSNAFSYSVGNGQLEPEPLQAAKNAIINVNGLTFERASNSVSDAIPGLTLQLNADSPGKQVRLTVNPDTAGVVDKVRSLVDTYNVIREFLVKATGPKVSGDDIAGSLQNNSSARSILVKLRSTVTAKFTEKANEITHWSTLGVTFDRDGVLQFDSAKFQSSFEGRREAAITALTNDAASPYVFSNQPSGLAGNIAVLAHQLTKSTGTVQAMSSSQENNLKRIEKKQSDLDSYIERMTAQYEKQFTAMDSILASFKETQSQLTRAFSTNNDN
jgi:flagellar hook-associated protein 2